MPTSQQRRLSCGESGELKLGVGPVVAQARIDGALDASILQQALDSLLRSRIVTDDDGPLLQYGAGAAPALWVVDTIEDPLVLELNAPITRERGLARVGLFRYDGDTVVSLAIDHCVADARLTTTLLQKLLGYYTGVTEGHSPNTFPCRSLETSIETLLEGRYEAQQIPAFPQGFTPALLPTPAPGGAVPTPRFGVDHVFLDRLAVTALIRQAREHGLTMHGLLSGTIAKTLSHRVDGPIALAFPLDLRTRLRPQLRADAQLLAIGTAYAMLSVAGHADGAELGRRITTQLNASIELALPQRMLLAQQAHDTSTPATMSISNLGLLDLPTLPTGTALRSIRFGTTCPLPTPALFASTTNGRLDLDLVYDRTYFTDEQMTQFSADIRGGLAQPTGIAA